MRKLSGSAEAAKGYAARGYATAAAAAAESAAGSDEKKRSSSTALCARQKSYYVGVTGTTGRWSAGIQSGKCAFQSGKRTRRNLGSFDDEEEAARAFDAAAREIRGEQAHGGGPGLRYRLNFPTAEEESGLVRLGVADVVERLLIAAGAKRTAQNSFAKALGGTNSTALVGVGAQGQLFAETAGPYRQSKRPRRDVAGLKACTTLGGKVGQADYARYEWGGHIMIAGRNTHSLNPCHGQTNNLDVIGSTVFKAATDAIIEDNKNSGWFEQHANGFTSQVRGYLLACSMHTLLRVIDAL